MSSYFMCVNDMIIMNNIEELKRFFFVKMNFWPLWPLDDPWGRIKYNFCSYFQCTIVTKFDQNPIKVCGRRNRLPERKKELESAPFPRARVKLDGRVSSYQVTQPLSYIFGPVTVAPIKKLLKTLFMYAQGQHPQPLVTRRSHREHFLMFDKDKYIDSATFVI